MAKELSLKRLLEKDEFPRLKADTAEEKLKDLQLQMLRIQQGVWHRKERVILVFEGFDAAGKGGTIRRLTEKLDPRGVAVHPIGPPLPEDQAKHYLYRFWKCLPSPGTIAIFDRSWYGRVLVERVKELVPKEAWQRAYREIREFERMLTKDGVRLLKFFLIIDADEQLKRFRARLEDTYKLWKLTPDDLDARRHWSDYVHAADEAFAETSRKRARWYLIPANDKDYARVKTLRIVTHQLADYGNWMEEKAEAYQRETLEKALAELEKHF